MLSIIHNTHPLDFAVVTSIVDEREVEVKCRKRRCVSADDDGTANIQHSVEIWAASYSLCSGKCWTDSLLYSQHSLI